MPGQSGRIDNIVAQKTLLPQRFLAAIFPRISLHTFFIPDGCLPKHRFMRSKSLRPWNLAAWRVLLANPHKEVFYLMKMTRTLLRRLEMKIHHAMTLDQVRKFAAAEQVSKTITVKAEEKKAG